ncbi:MAG: recombination-associated protein RdgC [Planctomycetota bacterium]
MVTIRRSGGAFAFFWQGTLPDPREEEFAQALANQRFRTIVDAASEEVSVGWITASDPSGDHFAPEDLEAGAAFWLRMRVDKKQLPRKWLAIHRDTAEKAQGRKLSARERRELKDDLIDKLLPRVLPTVNMVDALLYFERRTILLLNTSKSVAEAFHKLFFQSFGLPLERADPLSLGRRTGIDADAQARLDRVDPMRWPQRERSAPRPLPRTAHAEDRTTDDREHQEIEA